MTRGFYSRLAWSNICKNRKIYLPYIVAGIGMVLMFFIVLHLAMDRQVAEFARGQWAQLILRFGAIVMAIFSAILLLYTSSFLMKRRRTELGLYHVLGMGKAHLARVLLWETFFTGIISITAGVAGGAVFSKAAQVALLRMMEADINYEFVIDPMVVLVTAALYAGIYLVLYIKNVIELSRMNTVDLLYSKSQGEQEPKGNRLLALAGILLLGAGYYIAQTVSNPIEAIFYFFVAVVLVILGTNLTFISGSVTLLRLLKQNQNYYYKTSHFISTSSMMFRMKKHGAGLASICILSTMVLVTMSSTACLYFGSEDMMEQSYPRDLEVIWSMEGGNEATLEAAEEDLDQLIDAVLTEAGAEKVNWLRGAECTFNGILDGTKIVTAMDGDVGGMSRQMEFVLMNQDDYNRSYQQNISLEKSQVLVTQKSGRYREDTLTLAGKTYKVMGSADDIEMSAGQTSSVFDALYIVAADRNELKRVWETLQPLNEITGGYCRQQVYHGFDLVDGEGRPLPWGQKELIHSMLQEAYRPDSPWIIGTAGGNEPVFDASWMDLYYQNEEAVEVTALYGGLFFLGLLLSLVFLCGAVLIMYYKQIIEGYDDKERFDILQKVGMTKGEIKGSIRHQVLTMFFLPLLMAGIHMLFAFHIIQLMIRTFGVYNTPLLIYTSLGAFGIFAIVYTAVYVITSRAYYRIVTME